MNRRNFFGAMVGATAALVISPSHAIRRVEFSPPSAPPTIYWMTGHGCTEMFLALHKEIGLSPDPSQVKQGYASRKMAFVSMYISDGPLENFEPITYWIPGDYTEEVSA